MSVHIDPREITLWYKLKEEEWVECRNDILTINYQQRTITTAYDNEEEEQVAVIITAPFDHFQMECP